MAPANATATGPPLPNDVLIEIFLLLPAKSVLRFRAVCKPWRRLLSDDAFIRERHRRAPCAILLNKLYGGAISTLPLPPTDPSTAAVPLRCGITSKQKLVRLHGCCDGILLISCRLRRSKHGHFLCNPATRERARLPADLSFAGFYRHAPTAEYRVLCYNSDFIVPHPFEYYVAAPGRHRARKLTPTDLWPSEDFIGRRLSSAPVIHRGCLHWMLWCPSMGLVLVVFDTISEEFRRMRLPVPADGDTRVGRAIEVDGALGASLFTEGLVNVWVLVNYEEEAWTLRYSVDVSFLDPIPLRSIWIAHVSDEGDAVLMATVGTCYGVYNLRKGQVVRARQDSFHVHGGLLATLHVYKESLVSLAPKRVGAPTAPP